MGACNCTDNKGEQNTATYDPDIKFSISQKVAKQEAQVVHEAVIDFENNHPDPSSQPPTIETLDLESPPKPTQQAFLPEPATIDRSLDAQENPVKEPDASEPPNYKEFILGELTAPEKEVYLMIGNFKFLDQAKRLEKASLGEDVYIGDLTPSQTPNGFGLLLKPDKSLIEGFWTQGSIHGPGLQVYPNGDCYLGNFEHGLVEGQGKFVNYKGATYEGEWKQSKQNGEGTETWTDGAVYKGTFRDGRKEGYGRFVWADRAVYEGEFRSNNLDGKGKYSWPDGRVYEGSWRNNKMHGFGRFQWPDGKLYEGYYEDDLKHGKGTFTWNNGKKYDGYWQNNKMHGEGVLYHPDGMKTEGVWADGKQVTTT